MELYKEILAKILKEEEINIILQNLKLSATEIIEMKCYSALQKIKAILRDDNLSDSQCFAKIEEIVCVLESIGSSGGQRHDFG